MVGGGVLGNADTTKKQKESKYVVRPMNDIKSKNPEVNWLSKSVVSFEPNQN